MTINHITLFVSDFQKSRDFYKKALALLGYRLLFEDKYRGYAKGGIEDKEGKRNFLIQATDKDLSHSFSCLAFTAQNKEMVDSFYEEARAVGGRDNGAPGYRELYHPGYYAAYVLDPDGYNIEAVFDDFSRRNP